MSVYAALDSVRSGEGWLQASSGDGRFASLFGRDSLIAALQLLTVEPTIAHATLDRLGRELGQHDDPLTEEQPGKVLHQARDGDLAVYEQHGWPIRDGKLRYYGSADASAWFLIVFGALQRAGESVEPHQDAADKVAAYLAAQPMPVAYQRRNPTAGLQHHGWRDVAWDLEGNGHGVVGEDGEPLRPPVALAAIQALTWRALVEAGPDWEDAATKAKAAFDGTFGAKFPAFASTPAGLDHSITSDLGHLVWTGILDAAATARVTARLWESDMSTRFGLRTLSSDHAGFRVDGYHTGTVWPFDSWLGGETESVLAGVEAVGGYPELYVVDLDGTIRAHPESTAVQAWTVGAVIAIGAGWDGRSWEW